MSDVNVGVIEEFRSNGSWLVAASKEAGYAAAWQRFSDRSPRSRSTPPARAGGSPPSCALAPLIGSLSRRPPTREAGTASAPASHT